MSESESPLDKITFKFRFEKKEEDVYEMFLDDNSVGTFKTVEVETDEDTFFEVKGEKIA